LPGALNRRERGRSWTREEFLLGFVGDVGDLAKLVMAQEGARDMPGGRRALEHELLAATDTPALEGLDP
jgi:hypothetical protein